jgi:hypothetical protein
MCYCCPNVVEILHIFKAVYFYPENASRGSDVHL